MTCCLVLTFNRCIFLNVFFWIKSWRKVLRGKSFYLNTKHRVKSPKLGISAYSLELVNHGWVWWRLNGPGEQRFLPLLISPGSRHGGLGAIGFPMPKPLAGCWYHGPRALVLSSPHYGHVITTELSHCFWFDPWVRGMKIPWWLELKSSQSPLPRDWAIYPPPFLVPQILPGPYTLPPSGGTESTPCLDWRSIMPARTVLALCNVGADCNLNKVIPFTHGK